MWANSVWGFFGLAVTFMLAPLGLSPEHVWLAPYFMAAAMLSGTISVVTLVWPFIGKRIKVSGPFFLMALAVVLFLCGLSWQIWPKSNADSQSDEESLSAQERMRRKFVIDDATQDFLNKNPSADPLILAGLESAPQDFINTYLRRLGESWSFKTPIITPAKEGSIYVNCGIALLPVKMREGEVYHTIGVWPHSLAERGGAGWNTFVGQKDSEVNFGLKTPLVIKCEVISYAKAPIVDLAMALSLVMAKC